MVQSDIKHPTSNHAPAADSGNRTEAGGPVTAGRALSTRDRIRQKRLRWLGAAILVVGLTAAGVAYHRAQSDDWATALVRAGTLASGNAKRAENQLKELGGKASVLAADFQDWFASLWHRRRLAGTLVVLSLAGAGACFFVAHLLNYPPGSDHHADPPI